jgi:hypothetical protein
MQRILMTRPIFGSWAKADAGSYVPGLLATRALCCPSECCSALPCRNRRTRIAAICLQAWGEDHFALGQKAIQNSMASTTTADSIRSAILAWGSTPLA